MHLSGELRLRELVQSSGFPKDLPATLTDGGVVGIVELHEAYTAYSANVSLSELVHRGLVVVPSECTVSSRALSAWHRSTLLTGAGILAETPPGAFGEERTYEDLEWLAPALLFLLAAIYLSMGGLKL